MSFTLESDCERIGCFDIEFPCARKSAFAIKLFHAEIMNREWSLRHWKRIVGITKCTIDRMEGIGNREQVDERNHNRCIMSKRKRMLERTFRMRLEKLESYRQLRFTSFKEFYCVFDSHVLLISKLMQFCFHSLLIMQIVCPGHDHAAPIRWENYRLLSYCKRFHKQTARCSICTTIHISSPQVFLFTSRSRLGSRQACSALDKRHIEAVYGRATAAWGMYANFSRIKFNCFISGMLNLDNNCRSLHIWRLRFERRFVQNLLISSK